MANTPSLSAPSFLRRAAHALGRSARKARYKKLKARLAEIGDPKAVFSEIYADNLWNDAESRSGPGSTMAYTAGIRVALERIVRDRSINVFLDAPCGDFHWMRAVLLPETARYIGGDIVPALVDDLRKRYGDTRHAFQVLDITRGPLPDADIWMCRDCFFHLSYADIARALVNFATANIPLLLLTSHIPPPDGRYTNHDIVTGDARPIDVCADPFGFPQPVERFEDWIAPYSPREMGLWTREQVLPVAARLAAQFLA